MSSEPFHPGKLGLFFPATGKVLTHLIYSPAQADESGNYQVAVLALQRAGLPKFVPFTKRMDGTKCPDMRDYDAGALYHSVAPNCILKILGLKARYFLYDPAAAAEGTNTVHIGGMKVQYTSWVSGHPPSNQMHIVGYGEEGELTYETAHGEKTRASYSSHRRAL